MTNFEELLYLNSLQDDLLLDKEKKLKAIDMLYFEIDEISCQINNILEMKSELKKDIIVK